MATTGGGLRLRSEVGPTPSERRGLIRGRPCAGEGKEEEEEADRDFLPATKPQGADGENSSIFSLWEASSAALLLRNKRSLQGKS